MSTAGPPGGDGDRKPASLAEQQQALVRALWQPRHLDAIEFMAAYAHSGGAAALKHLERGLKAYRSNGHELARRALSAAYPVVEQLLGEENFVALARYFWQSHPPERGDLAQWGGLLAGFIAGLPDLSGAEPYLADVARAEWALHGVQTAADAPVDTASFALLGTCDPASITLVLSPGCLCLSSAYPVASIVLAHSQGEPSIEEVGARLRDGVAEAALVWRHGLKPCLRLAAPGEGAFIDSLQEKRSLLDSLAAAPKLDFNAWLAPAVQTGLLVRAHPVT